MGRQKNCFHVELNECKVSSMNNYINFSVYQFIISPYYYDYSVSVSTTTTPIDNSINPKGISVLHAATTTLQFASASSPPTVWNT